MFEKYKVDVSKGQNGRIEITPKLIEQTRRFLTRTIWVFHHNNMESKSGEAFEQWHEDKAKELLAFLNMSEADRVEATFEQHVGSSNEKRLATIE